MAPNELDFRLLGRLDTFVENAPDAAAMFDRDMRYLAVSPGWLRGYKIDGPVVGRSHYEVLPEIPERWREAHRRCLAGETLSEACEAFERSDGSVQWLRWEVRPWRLPDGGVGGVVIFTHDVSEMRAAETELAERAAHLRSILDTVPEAMIVMRRKRLDHVVQRDGGRALRLSPRRGGRPQRQDADARAVPGRA